MKKKWIYTLTSAASVLLLGACASGGDTEEASSTTSTTSTETEETTTTGSKELLIYSNSLAGGRQEWIDEKAKEAGFDLQYVEAGGGDILNRLLVEASSPQADVAFGMDEAMFFQLLDEELFVEYEPSWIGDIPADANVGGEYFHPLIEQRIFMMYNPEFVSEDEAPKNWQDLSEMPELEGMYRVPAGVASGTDQKAILSILLQYVDEDGDLGISQEGWDEVEKYLANGYQTPENEEQLQNFAEGKIPVSYHFLGGLPGAEEEFGFTAVPINPEQGVITMREQIGIINKGEDHDYSVAQEFVDWFGSDEMQGAFVEEFGGLPVNEAAVDRAPERLIEIANETEPMDVDWDFVRENLSSWMEKVELELMP
ncbi:extracellular solute-binding protein [Jeotgalibaca caeni]|uniref:extracellular solute-binding protein n=1 Tax=Jeotgalibaca caeni TaxID=3028623 RepID=UPI00237D54DB|nr:extracellular solute-binding protein [Jeotgalibaca caeni]MDE1549199.1 extracellular solute-binding protein [Jeotgalibaca caeni]